MAAEGLLEGCTAEEAASTLAAMQELLCRGVPLVRSAELRLPYWKCFRTHSTPCALCTQHARSLYVSASTTDQLECCPGRAGGGAGLHLPRRPAAAAPSQGRLLRWLAGHAAFGSSQVSTFARAALCQFDHIWGIWLGNLSDFCVFISCMTHVLTLPMTCCPCREGQPPALLTLAVVEVAGREEVYIHRPDPAETLLTHLASGQANSRCGPGCKRGSMRCMPVSGIFRLGVCTKPLGAPACVICCVIPSALQEPPDGAPQAWAW